MHNLTQTLYDFSKNYKTRGFVGGLVLESSLTQAPLYVVNCIHKSEFLFLFEELQCEISHGSGICTTKCSHSNCTIYCAQLTVGCKKKTGTLTHPRICTGQAVIAISVTNFHVFAIQCVGK